jgi:hypothetical protein
LRETNIDIASDGGCDQYASEKEWSKTERKELEGTARVAEPVLRREEENAR